MNKSLEIISQQPIGIFDSGIGGFTVFKEIIKVLPNEDLLYAADSLYAPYGIRSEQKIKDRVSSIANFFMEKKVKAIVVACNTATAVAVDLLRQNYDVPIVAIEPAIKLSETHSKNRRVGIIATQGTINSERFNTLLKTYKKDLDITIQIGEGLVEQIEKTETPIDTIQNNINQLVKPFIDNGIDSLILGCTHYPLVLEQFKKALGDNVNLYDPSNAVAKQLKKILTEEGILKIKGNTAQYYFNSSGKKANLQKWVEHYLTLPSDTINF